MKQLQNIVMMSKSLTYTVVLASVICLISSCSLHAPRDLQIDQTHQTYLEEIRLGDGVPLDLTINLRWKVKDKRNFSRQFANIDTYHQKILIPRSQEIVAILSNQFLTVDSVFGSQRQDYLARIKYDLHQGLADGLITIKEVIISQIRFPDAYTIAKEDIGMRNQELAHIEEQNKVDLAQADADRKRTEASNKIRIAQAEADGKLEKIQTQNPIYASFLVNRELAGQVEIAVLPTGTDPNVFKDLLHHNMPSHRNIGTISSPAKSEKDSK